MLVQVVPWESRFNVFEYRDKALSMLAEHFNQPLLAVKQGSGLHKGPSLRIRTGTEGQSPPDEVGQQHLCQKAGHALRAKKIGKWKL